MQQNAIAIFVKTPGLSPLKTRLAADIGEDRALAFYRLCLDAVEETARKSRAKAYWAVAEKERLSDPLWQGLERLHTGTGTLGERQSAVYSALREYHHNVMLIGADCPQLTPETPDKAFRALDSHDFVIGPARDGGYVFFAGRRALKKEVWTSVEYSRPSTCVELCTKLENYKLWPALYTDVDEAADLKAALDEMPDEPSEKQQAIIDWINTEGL